MTRYAIIENGTVQNITKADADFATAHGWIEAPAHVGPGWGYDGSEWTEPPGPSAEELRARMVPLSRAQFAIALAAAGVITETEAENWAAAGVLPSFALTAINNHPTMTDGEKMAARIKAKAAVEVERSSPIVALLQAAKSLTDAQVDALFIAGAAL